MPQRIFTTSTADSPMISNSNGIFISENFWSSCPRKVGLLILAAYLVKGTRQSSTSGVTSRSYGISVTTLEEVFLKVASGDAVPRCLAPQHSFQWSNMKIWSNQNQSSLKNSMEGVSVLQCPQRPHHVLTWSTLSYEMVFWASGKWPWLWFFKSIVIVISVLKYGEWWLAIQTHFPGLQTFEGCISQLFHKSLWSDPCDQRYIELGEMGPGTRNVWCWGNWGMDSSIAQ